MEKTWISSFISAWNLLLEIPFPDIGVGTEDEREEGDAFRTVVCFPVVGAVLGYIAYCISWLLKSIQTDLSAAAVSSILIVIGLEMATLGKNISALISFIEAKMQGLRGIEIIASTEKDSSSSFCRTPMGFMIFISVFLFRIICVGFLVYYARGAWLVVTLAISYAVQSKIATSADLRTSRPLIEADERSVRFSWFLAGIISFAIGLYSGYTPTVLLSFVLAVYLSGKFRKFCEDFMGGVTEKVVGLSGIAAETIILLMGIIFLIRD